MGKPMSANDLLRLVADSLPLAVLIDEAEIIRYICPAYSRVLSPEGGSLEGRHILTVIPNSRLPHVLRTGKDELGQLFVLKNGMPTVCNRMPLRDRTGQIRGAVSYAAFEDIDKITALSKELERLRRENEVYQRQLAALRQTPFTIDAVIGRSPPLQRLKKVVEKTADSDLCILLTGETGTGKEVFANALHQLSSRRFENFVKLNCAAIPKELLEAELFGYAEGAFSGAAKGGKPGKFELANHGTILLDEIGDMPLALQVKLLRVLQEQEVERVGALGSVKLDIRVICCTNQNLEQLVAEGKFRQDLYYRINVVELLIPPLRERLEDIPLLCGFFIDKFNRYHGCAITGLEPGVEELFLRYSWPGNVRELEHVLERACVMTPAGRLGPEAFDFFLPRIFARLRDETGGDLAQRRRLAEEEAVLHALAKAGGNRSQAARLLNISRSQFYEKLRLHGLS